MPTENITIEIEGKIGKYQTIPIDILITMARNLQGLINTLAINDLGSETSIDLNNFKLELSEFKKSSSVPSFCYSHHIQHVIGADVKNQRHELTDKFNKLMDLSNSGKYSDINDLYREPYRRGEITKSLYGFVNSFDDSPAKILDDTYVILYEIKPFKREIYEKIISTTAIGSVLNKIEAEKYTQLARVEITTGRKKPKVLELFDKKYNRVEFAPEIIIHKDKTYELRFPLLCTMDTVDDEIIIENPMLGIYAAGSTPDEAELMFSEEFDYIYTRYNELPDNKLTDDVKAIKTYLNHIIKK